jgi:hypothetical protein
MKTVLAPNAPWPNKPAEKPVAKKRVAPPRKDASRQAKTDKLFQQWAEKNLGVKK